MSIFYSSDQHFCHGNILKLCKRHFGSLAEMEEALVQNWNDKVRGDDTVYVLGDLFYGGKNNEKLQAPRDSVARAKTRYDKTVDLLKSLMDRRDEKRKEELMKAIGNSDRTYEEILRFIRG